MHRTSRAGSVSSTRRLRTNAWTADVAAIEAAIQGFELHRPLTNESNVAFFEIDRDAIVDAARSLLGQQEVH